MNESHLYVATFSMSQVHSDRITLKLFQLLAYGAVDDRPYEIVHVYLKEIRSFDSICSPPSSGRCFLRALARRFSGKTFGNGNEVRSTYHMALVTVNNMRPKSKVICQTVQFA